MRSPVGWPTDMDHDALMDYAADMLDLHGPEVDALTVAENYPRPLSQEELDFVFTVIDAG